MIRAATSAAVSIPMAKQIALRGADHRGVDADNPAVAVDQWAAGITRVQRRVGLDHAVDQPPGRAAQAAAERADDAGRDRRLKPERIADRDDQLADAQPRRAAEFGIGQPAGGKAQDCQIGRRIVADRCGFDLAAVGHRGGEPARAGDDMVVGQEITVRGEDDPKIRCRAGGRPR
jgi:hypothetical protein